MIVRTVEGFVCRETPVLRALPGIAPPKGFVP